MIILGALAGLATAAMQMFATQARDDALRRPPAVTAPVGGTALWVVSRDDAPFTVPAMGSAAAARSASAAGREIWRSDDGLFYVDAEINGRVVRCLVDTGASIIVLTPADADRVGAGTATAGQVVDTAAGPSHMAQVVLGEVVVAGRRAAGVRAVVASAPLGVSLLGQSWLSYFDAVIIEGDRMTLR